MSNLQSGHFIGNFDPFILSIIVLLQEPSTTTILKVPQDGFGDAGFLSSGFGTVQISIAFNDAGQK